MVAVNALDDAFGHVYKAFQLGGGALQGREVAELIDCLTIRGMSLGEMGRWERKEGKNHKTSVSLSLPISHISWTLLVSEPDSHMWRV